MGGRGGHSHFGGGGGAGGGGSGTKGAAKVSDWERFDRKEHPIPPTLRKALMKRFNEASETVRFIYDYYIKPGGEVSVSDYDKTAHYIGPSVTFYNNRVVVPNSIEMSFVKDVLNGAGKGTTWFHEHGHFIDFNMPIQTGALPAFIQAIKKDVNTYAQKIWDQHDFFHDVEYGKAEDRRMYEYKMVLQSIVAKTGFAPTNGIQDIYGSVWHRWVEGYWGHPDSYWGSDYDIGIEAAANMFEAAFDLQKSSAMKQYLPSSWKFFNDALEKERRRIESKK